MDPNRFRLATRIHFALLRQYGEDVDVAALLKGSLEAREALWVCEASDDRELVALAAQFRRLDKRPAPPAHQIESADAPQDAAWARNTSGFGATAPAGLSPSLGVSATRTLLKPSTWMRKNVH
jgi:hypothetical protein